MEDRLLTVGEVAKYIGCGQSTIWRLLREGRFLEPKRIGGMTRWLFSELVEFVKSGFGSAGVSRRSLPKKNGNRRVKSKPQRKSKRK